MALPEPAALTARERLMAVRVAEGLTYAEVGREFGLSERTLKRAAARPGFAELVAGLRREAADSACGEFLAGAREAAVELRRLMREGGRGDTVKLAAARWLADFALRYRSHLDHDDAIAKIQGEVAALRDRLTPPAESDESLFE